MMSRPWGKLKTKCSQVPKASQLQIANVKKLKEMMEGSRIPKYEGNVAENVVAKNESATRKTRTGCSLVTRK